MDTDRDAFLRAIRDRPDDALPRLIFADWLDEHGHAGEAAWLRADVRLAQSYPDADPADAQLVQDLRPPDGVPSLWLAKSLWDVAKTVAALFLVMGRSLGGAVRALTAAARDVVPREPRAEES
jgi:uncharacterized protein (TIGR02996 family)